MNEEEAIEYSRKVMRCETCKNLYFGDWEWEPGLNPKYCEYVYIDDIDIKKFGCILWEQK